MSDVSMEWQSWRRIFEKRSNRPLPRLDVSEDYQALPESLARSLAIFQLGESGGGTIVEQLRNSSMLGVDQNYAESMSLFVKEENRHANLLAMCVRMLNGKLIRRNWTARLFIFFRRLIGIRLKVLVLLAAEVVGLCYYHLLAARLPDGQIRRTLLDLVDDEQSHLCFHSAFLRMQTDAPWRRGLFVIVWRSTMVASTLAVMIDHRAAIRDMGMTNAVVWDRWMSYSRLAEQLVTATCETVAYPAHEVC